MSWLVTDCDNQKQICNAGTYEKFRNTATATRLQSREFFKHLRVCVCVCVYTYIYNYDLDNQILG